MSYQISNESVDGYDSSVIEIETGARVTSIRTHIQNNLSISEIKGQIIPPVVELVNLVCKKCSMHSELVTEHAFGIKDAKDGDLEAFKPIFEASRLGGLVDHYGNNPHQPKNVLHVFLKYPEPPL